MRLIGTRHQDGHLLANPPRGRERVAHREAFCLKHGLQRDHLCRQYCEIYRRKVFR